MYCCGTIDCVVADFEHVNECIEHTFLMRTGRSISFRCAVKQNSRAVCEPENYVLLKKEDFHVFPQRYGGCDSSGQFQLLSSSLSNQRKAVLHEVPPPLGRFRSGWKSPNWLECKISFFFKFLALQYNLYGAGSPQRAFVIRNVTIASVKIASVEIASVKIASVASVATTRESFLRSNSIVSLKEIPFSRRSNEDKLATKQSGPPRSNLNIKQIFLQRDRNHITEDFRNIYIYI